MAIRRTIQRQSLALGCLLALASIGLNLPAANAATLDAGEGKAYLLPSLAIAAASAGDRIVIAPGRYVDCAVIAADDIVIEGDPAGGTVIESKACQGKAALVAAGNDITVRDVTLANIRVADGNGAGIRAEGKNLTIERVQFLNNESGLLAGLSEDSTIVVRDSLFVGNGVCNADCAHGIYVGHIALLRIEHSTFRATHQGHHIKSRALRTEIVDCDIADGAVGNSSYLIDIPNGGALLIQSSTLQKGPLSENHTAAIMIGAEGTANSPSRIEITGNRFRNAGSYETAFVDNRTRVEAVLSGNLLEGRVTALKGAGRVAASAAHLHFVLSDDALSPR